MRAVFLDPIPAQVADLRRIPTSRPADLVLHDTAYVGARVLGRRGPYT
ncbi:hypothetical protein [Lentzea nigeriaca]|nr:hypothetical protein [Lentzea nigeriaca]MBM7863496.1 hypothetical protein [Lentzea nigeriaca]